MTRFYLIRHAITNAVGKYFCGRTAGVLLNDEGRTQAQQLAQRLAQVPIHAVYSSPLERALETAAPIAATHRLQTTACDDFHELDFGTWTNGTFAELQKQPTFQRFNSFRSGTRIPGGELMLEAQTRMVAGLQKLKAQHEQQTVVVVSHADTIKAAVAYYAGVPLDLFQRIEISPASVSVVELYDETARLLLVNDTGTLRF
jgi:probable phosphomutase (TIGR03848 family)